MSGTSVYNEILTTLFKLCKNMCYVGCWHMRICIWELRALWSL